MLSPPVGVIIAHVSDNTNEQETSLKCCFLYILENHLNSAFHIKKPDSPFIIYFKLA